MTDSVSVKAGTVESDLLTDDLRGSYVAMCVNGQVTRVVKLDDPRERFCKAVNDGYGDLATKAVPISADTASELLDRAGG